MRRFGGLVLAVALTGCSTPPDPDVVRDLENLGLPLYLPDLRGADLTGLSVVDGAVQASYDGLFVDLREMPYDGGGRPLCRALRSTYLADSDCTATEDSIVAGFEEMVTVAVVRGETVLVLRGTDESDPDLVEDALAALRSAPETSAADLVEAAS